VLTSELVDVPLVRRTIWNRGGCSDFQTTHGGRYKIPPGPGRRTWFASRLLSGCGRYRTITIILSLFGNQCGLSFRGLAGKIYTMDLATKFREKEVLFYIVSSRTHSALELKSSTEPCSMSTTRSAILPVKGSFRKTLMDVADITSRRLYSCPLSRKLRTHLRKSLSWPWMKMTWSCLLIGTCRSQDNEMDTARRSLLTDSRPNSRICGLAAQSLKTGAVLPASFPMKALLAGSISAPTIEEQFAAVNLDSTKTARNKVDKDAIIGVLQSLQPPVRLGSLDRLSSDCESTWYCLKILAALSSVADTSVIDQYKYETTRNLLLLRELLLSRPSQTDLGSELTFDLWLTLLRLSGPGELQSIEGTKLSLGEICFSLSLSLQSD
jgi:hypothetical protein